MLRSRCRALLIVYLLFMLTPSMVFGEDKNPPTLEKALERLDKALQKDPGLAPETKRALREALKALRIEGVQAGQPAPTTHPPLRKGDIATVVDEYLAARPPTREKMTWEKVLEDLVLYGDLRLRHETSFKLDDKPDRNRERMRARFGANYRLTDEVLVGARITTGNPDDPNSPHRDLGHIFDSVEISLDRVFMTYRPKWAEGAWVTAGKFKHPFFQNPVYSELVWDADVHPEGAVMGYTFSNKGRLEKLNLMAGEYVLLEQSNADEASLSVFQASSRFRLADHLRMNLAVGYYRYSDTTPDGSPALLNDNAGNATIDTDGDGTADEFLSDFGILNPIAVFTYDAWKTPLTIAGEYILNTRSRDNDQGWAAGFTLGTVRKQGDWLFYYQRQIIEQDSVFSAFTQDDFLFQTNHRSHVFGMKYKITDNMGIHPWGLISARDETSPGLTTDSDKDQWRVRLDLDIKF